MICPVDTCGRSMPAVAAICGACQADLRRALAAVPDVARDLDLTLSRQTSKTEGGGRSSVVPLPYDSRASEAGWVLRSALVGWVRMLVERAPDDIWPADTPSSMAAWISVRLSRLIVHPAAQEACEEITAAVAEAERVVDRPPGHVYAGPCAHCQTAMYARPGATYVRCPACRESYDVAECRDWMIAQCENLLGSSAYVAMVCRGLGVQISESTVRMWVKRRKLQPRTWADPRGDEAIREERKRPLYRVGDVIDVALGNVQKFTA